MKDYRYDVFLSFTGADRELKNSIRVFLEENGLKCYDSDLYCMGHFREDFCEALDQSKVYLMILTDNLKNDPMISSKGCLTEVRRECSLACQLEAANELNIVILCMSEFFRFDRPFHNYNDTIGWHFYSHTRGFSQIYGQKNEDGTLALQTLNEINTRCGTFVEKREANEPILSQMPKIDIVYEKLINDEVFKGREIEIESALNAFSDGKQMVVLRGNGGIGKTSLATEIAKRCEALEYLKCPQVVHIPDMVGGGDGISSVVSSVNYVDAVYDSLSSLSERERYERKLGALRALPETHLLVIDNFNSITANDIKTLLSKLKCRLLVTTRAAVEEHQDVAVLPIESLSEEVAREVFCEISGGNVEQEEFNRLYAFIGGHTITLCIMAKMMAVHKMKLTDLLDELGRDDETDAKVDFVHNDHGNMDTVMGHLRTLFNISGLSVGAMGILRSMSLLSDGTIATEELMQALGLKNRNEIIELVKNGWLDLQNRENEGGKCEYLYLHPILSLLMARMLVPTESNTAEMIAHIIQKVDAAKKELSYADATVLENRLFYACYVLAGGEHKLSKELWSRFMEVNHLLSDSENTSKKMAQLASRITDEKEKSIVITYGDMITLEQFPTRMELLDKYIQSLGNNADDYKWVMRSLSVMITHVSRVEKYKPFLKEAMEKAVDAAMKYNDHFALLDLMLYSVVTNGKDTTVLKTLKKYIDEEKKTGCDRDSLLYLEFYLTYFSLFSSEELMNLLSTFHSLVEGVFSDKLGGIYRVIAKHPIRWFHLDRIIKRVEKSDTADPVLQALQLMYGEGCRAADDGQLEMETVIQAAINLHMYRLEQQHTLTSACDSIIGVINLLSAFPERAVKKSACALAEMVDLNNITVKALSDLQVAVIINQAYGNREAIKQSRQLIDVVRRLRPREHSDVIYALTSYADICCVFGEPENGLKAYVEAYKLLMTVAPDSSKVGEISRKLLRLPSFSKFYKVEVIEQICTSALEGMEATSSDYYSLLQHYLTRLLERVRVGEITYDDSRIEEAYSRLLNAPAMVKKAPSITQNSCVYVLHDMASLMANHRQFDKADALCEAMKRLSRSKYKMVKNSAKIYYEDTAGYILFKKRDDEAAMEKFKKTITLCIKKHTHLSAACIVFWLMISILGHKGLKHMFESLIKTPKLMERLEITAQKWCKEFDERRNNPEDGNAEHFLCRHIVTEADKYAFKGMKMSLKEFKHMRSEEEFYVKALENLILSE